MALGCAGVFGTGAGVSEARTGVRWGLGLKVVGFRV